MTQQSTPPSTCSFVMKGLKGYFFSLVYMLVLAIFIACTRDGEGFWEYVSLIVILSVLILFSLLKAVKVAVVNIAKI